MNGPAMSKEAKDMVEAIADCLVEDHTQLMLENERLRRENSILRQELEYRIVSEMLANFDEMSEEECVEHAKQFITWVVLHEEGAE